MKRIALLTISLLLLIYVNACTGYKPIYSASNFKFKIVDHSIEGNKKLGNKIYSQFYNFFKSNKNNQDAKVVHLTIEVLDNKDPTVKNSAGKILEYRIVMSTNIILKDFFTNDEVLNHNIISYSSYKVQDQYSETIKLENRTIDNLLNKTYQDLLIKISETILTK